MRGEKATAMRSIGKRKRTKPTNFLKGRAYYTSKKKGQSAELFRFLSSSVSGLLVRVYVPDNIVGQAEDLVACALGHLGKSFGLGLVFEGV